MCETAEVLPDGWKAYRHLTTGVYYSQRGGAVTWVHPVSGAVTFVGPDSPEAAFAEAAGAAAFAAKEAEVAAAAAAAAAAAGAAAEAAIEAAEAAALQLRSSAEQAQRAAELRSTLAAALFEQKWSDLVFGELHQQVIVTCLEQGKLLGRLRNQLAMCFALMCTAHSMTVHDLVEARRSIAFYRRRAAQLVAGRGQASPHRLAGSSRRRRRARPRSSVPAASFRCL